MCQFLCSILNKLDPKCTVILAMIRLPLCQLPFRLVYRAVRDGSITPENTQV